MDYTDSSILAKRLYARVEEVPPRILSRVRSVAGDALMPRLRTRIARALERRGPPYPQNWRERPGILRLLDPPMTVEEICGPRYARYVGVGPKTISAAKRLLMQQRHLETWEDQNA